MSAGTPRERAAGFGPPPGGAARRALVMCFGVLALSAGTPGAAHAHALLVQAQPAPDAVVAAAAARTLTLTFSEPVDVGATRVRVLAGNGTRVDRGPAAPVRGTGDATVAVPLRRGLRG